MDFRKTVESELKEIKSSQEPAAKLKRRDNKGVKETRSKVEGAGVVISKERENKNQKVTSNFLKKWLSDFHLVTGNLRGKAYSEERGREEMMKSLLSVSHLKLLCDGLHTYSSGHQSQPELWI